MANQDIQDTEQAFLDDWVSAAHGGRQPAKKSRIAFLKVILDKDQDIYNSTWSGFIGVTHLGTAVQLQDFVAGFLDSNGPPSGSDRSATELITQFRDDLENEMERCSGFFSREIRSKDGKVAALGFSQNDAAEYSLIGAFKTALLFEEALRREGWVFPFEKPPSGSKDRFSRKKILELLRGSPSVRRKRK